MLAVSSNISTLQDQIETVLGQLYIGHDHGHQRPTRIGLPMRPYRRDRCRICVGVRGAGQLLHSLLTGARMRVVTVLYACDSSPATRVTVQIARLFLRLRRA